MFIDTHAHLYLEEFDSDRPKVIEEALQAEVDKILLPNIDLDSIHRSIELSNSYPGTCFSMIGLHPCSVNSDFEKNLERLNDLLSLSPFIAVGEIGIDLYWDKTFRNEQIRAFTRQVIWADELGLPIVIHSRNSLDLILDLLEDLQIPGLTGVFHCFTGSPKQAERILQLNFSVGIGGVITFKKSIDLRETLREIPMVNILLETDAPYLTPHPYRNRRNESKYIPVIAEQVSEVCKAPLETIAKVTSSNALKLFSLTSNTK